MNEAVRQFLDVASQKKIDNVSDPQKQEHINETVKQFLDIAPPKKNDNVGAPKMRPVNKSKPKIGGRKITDQQWQTLKDGGFIHLENMTSSRGQLYSAYVIIDDKHQQAFMFKNRPDEFVKYGQYEMRAMDKRLIEAGYVVKATVKWYGMNNYAHPYLWKPDAVKDEAVRQLTGYKLEDDSEYCQSWSDPRKTVMENNQATTKLSPRVVGESSVNRSLQTGPKDSGNTTPNAVSATLSTAGEVASSIGGLFDTSNADSDTAERESQNHVKEELKRKKRRGIRF